MAYPFEGFGVDGGDFAKNGEMGNALGEQDGSGEDVDCAMGMEELSYGG